MANDPIESARQLIHRALAARDGVDISWIQPPPESSGWTLAGDALRFIDALVRELRPKHVIEFGAGLSTKVLARACVQMNSPCAISSVDHDPEFGVSDTRKFVESTRNLTLSSQIAPLVARDYGGKLLPTYFLDRARFASKDPADLVLIDGPPVDLGGREGVLYQVLEFCKPGTIVLLDDARRLSEVNAAKSWKLTLDDAIDVEQLPHFTKGMAAIIVRHIIKPDELWARRINMARRIIEGIVKPGASFVLVERDQFGEFSEARKALPLVSRNGQDWGLPENPRVAIEELKARAAEGATHFVLPWTSFWWSDTYADFFAEFLKDQAKPYHDGLILAFELQK